MRQEYFDLSEAGLAQIIADNALSSTARERAIITCHLPLWAAALNAVFTNLEVPIEDLPAFEHTRHLSLSPRYRRLVLGITLTFVSIFLLGFIALHVFVLEVPFSARIVMFALVIAVSLFLVWFLHKSASVISYAIREHDVIVRAGVFWKKETIQPISRVQHVERLQGPLDKRFGLAKLKLFSAGTGHFTFEIPGLEEATALHLQEFILERKKVLNETPAEEAQSGGDA